MKKKECGWDKNQEAVNRLQASDTSDGDSPMLEQMKRDFGNNDSISINSPELAMNGDLLNRLYQYEKSGLVVINLVKTGESGYLTFELV